MRREAPLRSEVGQTTALVCAMLFTLTLFVALVVNVGQLVNRRVSLQVVADAGAWSGATVQAVQMNHYAFWSRQIQNAYKAASGVSFRFNFSECASGVAAVALFTGTNAAMIAAQGRFANAAYREAESHSYFNIDDLFPGERNNFDFSTMAGPDDGTVAAPLQGNILAIPLRRGERLHTGNHAWRRESALQVAAEVAAQTAGRAPWAVSSAGNFSENWQCFTYIPPATVISFRIYMAGPAGYKLQKPVQPYIFVWRVKERRPTRALFFDSFFGPNAFPAMTAVAVAKAVGGDIHRGQSQYRAKMIPVSRYSLAQGFIRDPLARPGRVLPNPLRRIVH